MKIKEIFIMPLYKCKNCGKVISEPNLHSFSISYNNYKCHGRWCLCDECLEKGITKPKCAYFSKKVLDKNTVEFLSELVDIISHYKVNSKDVFY